MIKTYNKLVRDRIPEIIEAAGNECKIRILSDKEYLKMVDAKLDEELAEYHKDQNIEELADLLEVIYAAAKSRGYSQEQLEAIRKEKAEKRGGFEKRILLKSVTDVNVNTELIALINTKQSEIMGKITERYLLTYLWLQDHYMTRDISADEEFRRKFSSYYQMRYVSQSYRDQFFAVFEEIKRCKNVNFIEISRRLFSVDKRHEFSFISKMLHTIDPTHPIYDSQVDAALQLRRTYKPTIEKKLEQDANILNRIIAAYGEIKSAPVIMELSRQIDAKTPGTSISMEKKLDFILWALGGL